jgi:hypothetical protein
VTVGTLHARAEAHIFAVWARYKLTLGPNEQEDYQPDRSREKNKQHPQHRIIHAARSCISCDPDKDGDIEDQQANRDDDNCAANSATSSLRSCIISSALGQQRVPGQKTQQGAP